jgi:hypothetical protein
MAGDMKTKILLSTPAYRKYNMITSGHNHSYIVRYNPKPKANNYEYSLFLYEKQDTMLGQFIWWQLFRLFNFLRIL